jgi:hypothetical protein
MVQKIGLVACVMHYGRSIRCDSEFITALAKGAAARDALISDEEKNQLAAVVGPEFFTIQNVMCDVIPKLQARPSDMMALVSVLVDCGGQDLAANLPNAAFRKWCAADENRAAEVITSARAGNALALRHLVFALEAREDVNEALRSARAEGDERTAGILALSRMTLTTDEAKAALEVILAATGTPAAAERAGPVKAALAIASKHPSLDRSGIADALAHLSRSSDPIIVHMMATALYSHGESLTDAELGSCLSGIQALDPGNSGHGRHIDDALNKLWSSRPREAGKTIGSLIAKTERQVGNDALDRILSSQSQKSAHILAELVTEWLGAGDPHICAALASHLSEINKATPCLQVDVTVLPADPKAQVFVCRKAIGYLFHAPMTAASWLVAVMRTGGPAARHAADLLFDPLLLNYGGALKHWLDGLLEEDALGNDMIRQSLIRAQEVLDGFAAAREVVELEPSSAQRALIRFQEAEEAERVFEAAREQSIFADLFTTQTLLYGDRSSFSILDGQGVRQSQTTNLSEMSISGELPRCLFFDPVGLEWMLDVFRCERRTDQ